MFDPKKFFLAPEETLAQKLNYAAADIKSHGGTAEGRWYQFGAVALLKTTKNHAFSCMMIGNQLDLADYGEGSSCQELKELLDKGEGLGDAFYQQFDNPYDVIYYINKETKKEG